MTKLVGIIMGSKNDWEVMQHTGLTLKTLEVGFEARVLSAHRTPEQVAHYIKTAADRSMEVIIAGAGAAAHLAGAAAANTHLPVLGVPIDSSSLQGLDSLLATVQMPRGVPVATLAIGKAGAINAALLAVQILSLKYPAIKKRYLEYKDIQVKKVLADTEIIS